MALKYLGGVTTTIIAASGTESIWREVVAFSRMWTLTVLAAFK